MDHGDWQLTSIFVQDLTFLVQRHADEVGGVAFCDASDHISVLVRDVS